MVLRKSGIVEAVDENDLDSTISYNVLHSIDAKSCIYHYKVIIPPLQNKPCSTKYDTVEKPPLFWSQNSTSFTLVCSSLLATTSWNFKSCLPIAHNLQDDCCIPQQCTNFHLCVFTMVVHHYQLNRVVIYITTIQL